MAVLGLDPRINPAIPIECLLTRIASFASSVRVADGRIKPDHDGVGESIISALGITCTIYLHQPERSGCSGRNNTSTKAQPAIAAPARKVAESA
jgi:hypothetical protein